MDCEGFRHAISARLDGEEVGIEAVALGRHLATCAACQQWEEEVTTLTRSVRLGSADPIPDLTPVILAAIGARPGPPRRRAAVRVGLAAVAGLQLVLGALALLFGDDDGGAAHLAHELGSFDLALAVGYLCAAWRPARAYGMLPLAAALVACLAITSAVDLAEGHAVALAESAHLLVLAGFGLVWLLARSGPAAPLRRYRLLGAA